MSATRHILATKLYRPPPTTTLVARLYLIGRLEQTLRRPLTTIIAPTGFGKTTLVSTWVAATLASGTAAVAWLTLDAYDDDPVHFWTSVIAAFETIDGTIGDDVLPLLNSSATASPEYLLTPLINTLVHHSTTPRVLVLDDYHVISALPIHAGLSFLVEHLPPNVHMILASRSDPPLPIARLRARGQLLELRAAELRFSAEEAGAFLNDVMGLELSVETIAKLEARTEGWIAGLHLVALSMQDRSDRDGFVHALTGTHRYILDYLVEEVLQQQPAPIRDFLLRTSILERFCVALCQAVIRTIDTAATLASVERANLFLVPLDDERRWYRYHHLFVEMLRAYLEQEQPTQIRELHRRASDWYAEHAGREPALHNEAIRHALAAGDGDRAAQLIGQVAEMPWTRHETSLLYSWLTALPTAVLHAHPQQAILLAQILLSNGSHEEIPPLLDAAREALLLNPLVAHQRAAIKGGIAAIRSQLTRIAENYDRAIVLAEEALALLPATALTGLTLAAQNLAMAYHMQGNLVLADDKYRAATKLGESVDDRFYEITARCLHGRLLREHGDLVAAEAAFQQALERATSRTQLLPIGGWALAGLASIAYARGDLPASQALVARGLDLVQRGGARYGLYNVLSCKIRLHLAEGSMEAARDSAAHFTLAAATGQTPQVVQWAAGMQALVALRTGNLTVASAWALTYRPRPWALFFSDKAPFEVFIQILLAEGQTTAAQHWIEQKQAHPAIRAHVETRIELHLLETLALYGDAHHEAAYQSLGAALALAAPAGFIRLFLDHGEPIHILLAQRPSDDPHRGFAAQLLAAFSADQARQSNPSALGAPHPAHKSAIMIEGKGVTGAGLVEPLSERERQVLALMAAGLSNQGIAERLVISVPTVKKHGSNIFGKLQATSRSEAVARAREVGLLA
ncbi:MAG: LuxR C-terminal-related transcriptional regulator [Herpetosiphon sp.]